MALHHDLINLYQTARIALAAAPRDRQSTYDRMLWAAKEFAKANPGISEARAYRELSRMRDDGSYVPRW